MYRAEIDENGVCFHMTDADLPLGDRIKAVDSMDVLGWIWDGEKFNPPEPQPEPDPQPTPEEQTHEMLLTIMDAIAEQYEDSQTQRLDDMEVQATIYETLLGMVEQAE